MSSPPDHVPAPFEERFAFVLEGQGHCDHFLTPLADPRGKRVLVAGCGAGTEMLWCLRRGAREVTGIDILPQEDAALLAGAERLGVRAAGRYAFHTLPIERVGELRRRFDLALSNNVFEHVRALGPTLAALAGVLAEEGRIAVFSDPLWFSSVGSHLDHEPWEHLWGDLDDLRARLLRGGKAPAAVKALGLQEYFDREITLNRLRYSDYVAAVKLAGLEVRQLGGIPDRNRARFAEFEPRIRARLGAALTVEDLTTEGFFVELGLPRSALRLTAPGPLESLVERLRRRLRGAST
jgi:SAM-dependent methyltransferase